jgi:hypothetical protein
MTSFHSRFSGVFFVFMALSLSPNLRAADPEFTSELFEHTRLVYEDTFDGTLNTEFWEIRQSTTWVIKDGILTGSQSSKEFQEIMTKKGEGHEGFMPVIWLKQVPENFVCSMRMRYNSDAVVRKPPLFDLGHHIHTLSFTEKMTTLTIKKNIQVIKVEAPILPLNQWADVTIELKKGIIILKIGEKKHRFKSPEIDMAGQHQIDFKGINFGSCQIDHIKLWEGLSAPAQPEAPK